MLNNFCLEYKLFFSAKLKTEVIGMAKMQKNPSKAAVSAASVKGNAGPNVEMDGSGKKTSQNQQYKKANMQGE
jgi:YuzL-like protein